LALSIQAKRKTVKTMLDYLPGNIDNSLDPFFARGFIYFFENRVHKTS